MGITLAGSVGNGPLWRFVNLIQTFFWRLIELPIIACPCLLCNLSHSYFLFQVSFISFYRSGYFATWRLCRLWSKKERVLSSLHSSCEPSLASAVIMQSAVMQHSQLFAAKIFSSSFHLAMPISSSLSDAMIIMRYKCHRTFVIRLFPAPLPTLCSFINHGFMLADNGRHKIININPLSDKTIFSWLRDYIWEFSPVFMKLLPHLIQSGKVSSKWFSEI